MIWRLWLDDERQAPPGCTHCKSSVDALELCKVWGPPEHMHLDHDLGGEDTTMVFLRGLFAYCPYYLPTYSVHSQNPVGRDNIHAFMRSWEKFLEDE